MKRISIKKQLSILLSCFILLVLLNVHVYAATNNSSGNGKAQKIVTVAKREVGNKYAKYTKALGKVRIEKKKKNGKIIYEYTYKYPWCHAFISWCAAQVKAKNLVPQTTSCYMGVKWFKEKNRWKARKSGYKPQTGDIIYFDWTPENKKIDYNHVGIVDYVSSDKVYTIEGNVGENGSENNKVKKKDYLLSDNRILGYGVPEYSDIDTEPLGAVDSMEGGINKISLGGWAYDPDNVSKAVDVRIKIGSSTYTIKADKYRKEVAPTKYHGYVETISVKEVGKYTVNVYAVDINTGKEKKIGSRTIVIESKKSPVGHVDAIGGGEGVVGMSGWAYDPDDVSQALKIKLQLVGGDSYTITADGYRTGVAPTNNHGFSVRIPVKEIGTYNYKVYALDIGKYRLDDILLKSGKITIKEKLTVQSPVGHVDAIGGGEGVVGMSGWAYDPDDVFQALKIKLQLVGGNSYTITADGYRTSVAPTNNHGFSVRIPVKEIGTYSYKVYALDIGKYSSSDTLIGSGKITINPLLTYQAHVQSNGWLSAVKAGETAGTTGKSKQMEAIKCTLLAENGKSGIKYQAHCRSIGWQGWKNSGEIAGTVGQSLRMEAVQFKLCNGLETKFNIEYRAHVRNVGWGAWVRNGQTAGTTGQGLPIEAVQIRLVAK